MSFVLLFLFSTPRSWIFVNWLVNSDVLKAKYAWGRNWDWYNVFTFKRVPFIIIMTMTSDVENSKNYHILKYHILTCTFLSHTIRCQQIMTRLWAYGVPFHCQLNAARTSEVDRVGYRQRIPTVNAVMTTINTNISRRSMTLATSFHSSLTCVLVQWRCMSAVM